jgi:hypothetical protein
MPGCAYKGSEYATGALVCIDGTARRCQSDGTWEDSGEECVQGDGIVIEEPEGGKHLPAD